MERGVSVCQRTYGFITVSGKKEWGKKCGREEKRRAAGCRGNRLDVLVPEDHLPRKIRKVMDCDWLYERLQIRECS